MERMFPVPCIQEFPSKSFCSMEKKATTPGPLDLSISTQSLGSPPLSSESPAMSFTTEQQSMGLPTEIHTGGAKKGMVSAELYEKLLASYQELQDTYDRMMVTRYVPKAATPPSVTEDTDDVGRDSSGALPTIFEGSLG